MIITKVEDIIVLFMLRKFDGNSSCSSNGKK